MGESITNVACLEQSVSFGRFERDSLCWERWSTFPTNKYLEEVEKCSTPGSVAQKKAYFEAHYKKIAARRAELLLDQERKREAELVKFEELNNENEVGGSAGEVSVEHDHMKSNIADMLYQENVVGSFDGEVKSDSTNGFNEENDVWGFSSEIGGYDDGTLIVNDVSELSNVISEECEDVDEYKDSDNTIDEVVKIEVTKDICELNDGADVIDEVVKSEVTEHFDNQDDGAELIKGSDKRAQEEFATVDLCLTSKIPVLETLTAPASMIEDVPSILESKGEELPQETVKRTIVEEESGNQMKLVMSKKMQKATLAKKTTSTTNTKKLPTTPVPRRTTAAMPKSPMLPTPKSSKPELIKVAKSSCRVLDKKENVLTPLTIKKTVGPQSRRVVPTSLHMSLSLGPMNSDQASLTMRKSLIMERMGDKDIVKRAFKAFQNSPQTSPSSLAKPPSPNKSASRKAEQKGFPTNALPNKNERIGRPAKTACSTRTGQQGARKTLLSPGENKNGGADQRNVKSVTASFGPRVQQGNNQNEVSKKLDLKARSNVFETTYLQSKLKVEKAAQVKKPSQSINSKTKLPSSYNHRHGGSVHKEVGKAQASG